MKNSIKSRIYKISLKFLLFTFLTILTQIGGLVYVLSLFLANRIKFNFPFKKLSFFLVLYAIATFLIVPMLAPVFGRERIKNTNSIKPVNIGYVLLNRNYVVPQLNILLQNTSDDLKENGSSIELLYLDANFPFINGFPLLPHSTHSDGKKIDFGLVYENEKGEIHNLQKSRSGYGVFEKPLETEIDQTEICLERGYFYYEFPQYLTLGSINKSLVFSEEGTKILLLSLLKNEVVEKVFVEPNLKNRLKLDAEDKIVFQGCRSVRHDDHIHLQVK
jgi:hypothetical protein